MWGPQTKIKRAPCATGLGPFLFYLKFEKQENKKWELYKAIKGTTIIRYHLSKTLSQGLYGLFILWEKKWYIDVGSLSRVSNEHNY